MPEAEDTGAREGPRRRSWLDLVEADNQAVLFGALLLFVCAWFGHGVITGMGKALHNDLTEAYVWGREFRLGYNQHPPFWAWIAGVWFMVFPNTNWAFVLLAVVNAAVGLVGAWRLAGQFAEGWTRRAAVLLLLCTPFFTFKSYTYNANSIFLSLWPWTYLFFVQAMETRRAGPSVWFGVLVGLCLLSKYYAVVIILTCIGASFLHPGWRRYYRSSSPWIAVGVACLLFLPHGIWAVLSDAPPVAYALGITGIGAVAAVGNALGFLLEVTAFHGVVLAIVLLAWRLGPWWARRVGGGTEAVRIVGGRGAFIAGLALLPVGLTVVFGLGLEVRIAGKMTIGIFPLLPLWLLQVAPSVDARLVCGMAGFVAAGVAAAALAVAPAITARTFETARTDPSFILPQQELAAAATELWRRETHAPLRYVGGSKYIGNAVAFYSADRPSGFVMLSFREAPWVTPEALRRDGLLAVCLRDDPACYAQAERLSDTRTTRTVIELAHRFGGRARAPVTTDVFIMPPQPAR